MAYKAVLESIGPKFIRYLRQEYAIASHLYSNPIKLKKDPNSSPNTLDSSFVHPVLEKQVTGHLMSLKGNEGRVIVGTAFYAAHIDSGSKLKPLITPRSIAMSNLSIPWEIFNGVELVPLVTLEYDETTNTYYVIFRGTAFGPEFVITTGNRIPFSLSLEEITSILDLFPNLDPEVKSGFIKKSVADFATAKIDIIVKGKSSVQTITLIPSFIDQIRELVGKIPDGANVYGASHSMGDISKTLFSLAMIESKKKFGTCIMANFGPFPTVDPLVAKFIEKKFPGEQFTFVCINDGISRMTNPLNFLRIMLFSGVDLALDRKDYGYAMPGTIVGFHMKPATLSVFEYHDIRTYAAVFERDNLDKLYRIDSLTNFKPLDGVKMIAADPNIDKRIKEKGIAIAQALIYGPGNDDPYGLYGP